MSRAVVAHSYGAPAVLEIVERDVPEPGEGRVRIAVRAAAINPADLKQLAGVFGDDPARLPLRLGAEVSGVVTALGPGATGALGPLAIGDEVVAYRVVGGFADDVVALGRNVFPKPAPLNWAQASGMMLAGAAAVHLVTATEVSADDRVLIHGAAGAVGLAAVQLARTRGASTVVGTALPRDHELLRAHGVTPLEFGDGLRERLAEVLPDGADVALDTAGAEQALAVSLELVPDRARIATIANFAGGLAAGVRVLGDGAGADPGTEIRAAAREELVRLADAGSFTVVAGEVFPLERAVEAFELVARGPVGKVTLAP